VSLFNAVLKKAFLLMVNCWRFWCQQSAYFSEKYGSLVNGLWTWYLFPVLIL